MATDVRSAVRDRLEAVAPQLLNREEAASYLHIKPQTLAVWHSTGRYQIPVIKVGRCCRYRVSDLDKFIASRTVGTLTLCGQFHDPDLEAQVEAMRG